MQARAVALDGAQEPGDGGVRLLAQAEADQRLHREGGVAYPAEAVVPFLPPRQLSGSEVVAAAAMAPVG